MQRVEVKPGDVVVQQGGEGDCFYVVGNGEFEVLATQVKVEKCPSEVFIHVSATKCWDMVRERVNNEIRKHHNLGKVNVPTPQPPGSLDGLEMFGFTSPAIIQQAQNFGEPFFLIIHEGETLADVKTRVQKKLQVPDEEFAKMKRKFLKEEWPFEIDDVTNMNFQDSRLKNA